MARNPHAALLQLGVFPDAAYRREVKRLQEYDLRGGLYERPQRRGSAAYTENRRNMANTMHEHIRCARQRDGVVPVTDTHVDPEVAAVVDAITGIGDTTRLTHVRQQALSVVINAFHNVDHLAVHIRRDRRHPNSARCAPDVHHVRIALLADALRWPDVHVASDFWEGFAVIGEIADSGVHRPIPAARGAADISLTTFWTEAIEATRQNAAVLLQRGRNAVDDTALRSVVDASYTEQVKGFAGPPCTMREWYASHATPTRPMPRFPKEEATKIRPVDDGTRSGANAATTMHETPVMPPAGSITWPSLMLAKAGFQPVIFLDDVADAYRQLPNRDPGATAVMYYDPEQAQVMFREIYGLNFGLKSAPAQFCRVSAFMQAVIRRLFCIATSAYVDDFFAVDAMASANAAQNLVHEVFALVGIRLKTQKAVRPNHTNVVLGIEVDLSQALSEATITYRPTEQRTESILHKLRHAADADTILPTWARRFAGKLEFFISATDSAIIRYHVKPFHAHAEANNHRPSSEFRSAVAALLNDIPRIPPRVYRMPRVHEPRPIVVYVDARHDGQDVGIGALLFVDDEAYAVSADAPIEWVQHMQKRARAIINQAELLAIDMALRNANEIVPINGRRVVVYSDSTSALAAAVRGTSNSSAHLAEMGHRYRRFLWETNAMRVYHEYVPTDINPADPLSRIVGGLTQDRLRHLDSEDLLRWCAVAGYRPTIVPAIFPKVPVNQV